MIHDEFIKSAAITNKVINKAVGSAGDIYGNLLDKAFNFGKKKKPGFFKRQSEKIKSGFSNKNVREEAYSTNIKNKVDNPNPDAQYRSASRNFSQENPQSDNFVPGESKVIKGLEGIDRKSVV